MLLSWHTLKDVIGARTGADAVSAEMIITGHAVRGDATLSGGAVRPFAVRIGATERIGLRILAGKLEKKLRPDHVDAVALAIDWQAGTGEVTVFYRRDGEKLQHTETHTFDTQ